MTKQLVTIPTNIVMPAVTADEAVKAFEAYQDLAKRIKRPETHASFLLPKNKAAATMTSGMVTIPSYQRREAAIKRKETQNSIKRNRFILRRKRRKTYKAASAEVAPAKLLIPEIQ